MVGMNKRFSYGFACMSLIKAVISIFLYLLTDGVIFHSV